MAKQYDIFRMYLQHSVHKDSDYKPVYDLFVSNEFILGNEEILKCWLLLYVIVNLEKGNSSRKKQIDIINAVSCKLFGNLLIVI